MYSNMQKASQGLCSMEVPICIRFFSLSISRWIFFAKFSLILQILRGLLAFFGRTDEFADADDVILSCFGDSSEIDVIRQHIRESGHGAVEKKMDLRLHKFLKAQFDKQPAIALGSSSQPEQIYELRSNMIILGPIPNIVGAFSCNLDGLVPFVDSQKPRGDWEGYGLITDVKEGRVSVRFGTKICCCNEDHVLDHYRVFEL
jgi:hypothetical protein